MTEIMPFPENNIILFYWTAPQGEAFASEGQSATTSSEALAAEHGTILTGLEGNLGGLAAFGAHSVEHLAGRAGSGTGSLAGHAAVTAAGGLILEALLGVECLFTGRENELVAAVFAYQRLVFVHGLEPPEKILNVG